MNDQANGSDPELDAEDIASDAPPADGDSVEVQHEDLVEAIAASSMPSAELTDIDNGDGTVQTVAIGPAPTMSPVPVFILFTVGFLCAIGFVVAYTVDASTMVMGSLLGGGLAAIGIGLITWARKLLPESLSIEQRPGLDQHEDDALEADFARGEMAQPYRRKLLTMMLAGTGGLGIAALAPLLSLGPREGKKLATTSWRKGSRLVLSNGTPVHRDDIPMDGSLTVYPEGHTSAADSQAMLIRVPEHLLSDSTAKAGTVEGRLVYSKVCTHVGCPVSQFRVDSRKPDTSYEMLCPCHQSLFNVLDGAKVLAGPAATPLQQLPISVDDDGFLVATGAFPGPIGPSYWGEP